MALPAQLNTVAVIGNGIIGHGIAQVFAMAGRNVVMIGRAEASLAAAVEKIRAGLQSFLAHAFWIKLLHRPPYNAWQLAPTLRARPRRSS